MVEIMEEGKLDYYKIKCNKCNSILKFTALDEEEEYDLFTYFFIECPKCNQKNITRSYSKDGMFIFRELIEQPIDSQGVDFEKCQ